MTEKDDPALAERAKQAEPVALDELIDMIEWYGHYRKSGERTSRGYVWEEQIGVIKRELRKLYAAPPAAHGEQQGYTISRDSSGKLEVTAGTYEDDEAVKLLKRATETNPGSPAWAKLCDEIDAYLARVRK